MWLPCRSAPRFLAVLAMGAGVLFVPRQSFAQG